MRRNNKAWPVFSVNTRRSKIDPRPPYQRGLVWSRNKKQLFIDSMLRDFDIPKLYLRRIADTGSEYEWEVVDGQQRLTAIWEFLKNEYPVSTDADDVDEHEIKGKIFDDLHSDVQDQLQGYELNMVELEDADDQEMEEMFLRLQDGVPLNAAEKRNAISGNVRDFVRDVASTHQLMTSSLPFPDMRYSYDEIVAQMLLIELNGGPTAITAAKLRDMYRQPSNNLNKSTHASKLRGVLNFLGQAFPTQSPELTKTNIISLYTIASESLTKYAIRNRARGFGKWFVDFERRRREQMNKPEDQMDQVMFDYQSAVLQGSRSVGSQQERRRVLLQDMLVNMPDLKLLDDQRLFTYEQRVAIFRKSNGKCINPSDNPDCSRECTWNNFHADHIVPYSAGGKTVVENGQLLCPSCNLKKSDSNPEAA